MKKKNEFSKVLLIQESALIWINTIAHIVLAFYCVMCGYAGALPWVSASASLPWVAYGVSQGFYYNKAKAENSKNGIKYDTVMAELNKQVEEVVEQTTTFEIEIENDNKDVDINYGI